MEFSNLKDLVAFKERAVLIADLKFETRKSLILVAPTIIMPSHILLNAKLLSVAEKNLADKLMCKLS